MLCLAFGENFISVRWKLWKLWSAAITKWLCQTASIPRTEWGGHTSLMFDDRKPKFNLYNLRIASQLKNAIPRMKLGNHVLTQHFTCAQTTMCCVRWWRVSSIQLSLTDGEDVGCRRDVSLTRPGDNKENQKTCTRKPSGESGSKANEQTFLKWTDKAQGKPGLEAALWKRRKKGINTVHILWLYM